MPLLDAATPAGPLHRIGYLPEPLVFPPWEYTGGGRYDDPLGKAAAPPPGGRFRTLYAADRRLSGFLESIGRFRRDPKLEALMRPMDPDMIDPDALADAGTVSTNWRETRGIQALQLAPGQRWLDLRETETVQVLRGVFARELANLGLTDLDNSTIRSVNRRLTQAIARWVYQRGYQGVVYRSRFSDECDAWALFEHRAEFTPLGDPDSILADDPDLMEAARLLRLTVA